MKKVSIIVPVYNVEQYLDRCLESLVNQTLKDIEIILINDGSIDGSQKIIERYKANYPEMIKSYYIKNGGAAKARNYAFNYVTGKYIGFVDSDDYISEEMYEKLYNKAEQANADIVCCNYYRVYNNDRYVKKQFGNSKIVKEELFDKNVYDANLLFDEVPYLWNKIFKTDIIKKNNFKFCDDLRIYEDLLFTYQAFSVANKISRIDDALYYYTVFRDSSLTHYFTEKRFDIFKVSDKLINYYKKLPQYEKVNDALLYVLLKHIYVILEKRTHYNEKILKIKYINKVFNYLDKEFPSWRNSIYFQFQKKDKNLYTSKLYWKMCTILGVNIIECMRRLKKIIVKRGIYILLNKPGNIYIKQCKKPIEEKSIFIFSQQGNNLNGNMFYILKELATNEIYKDFKIYVGYTDTSKMKFKSLLKNYQILDRVCLIKNRTGTFAKKLASSKYLFTDTSMPIYFIKREEQIYLNTWHGTPFKTLGKSTENDFFDIANVQKNFVVSDYLLYPSEYMMDTMIKDYMLKGIANNKIMLCGYPRNEIFLRDDMQQAKEKNGIKNKVVIAYMPTWRGSVRDIDIETQLNIAEKNIQEISSKLKENQILYVNMHPYIGNKLDLSKFDNVRCFPKDVETYDFLSTCDILITDYSSVFFDFAITNKKIILFAYDEETYFANRGVYLTFNELPFPKVKNVQDLIKEINSPIEYDTEEFIKKFCHYDRKDISKLICEKILLNKQNDITILDMPKSEKENILLYIGNFKPNNNTKEFIKLINNTEILDYNYYVTYITKNLKQHKESFKKIINKINFYGQLGNNPNLGKFDIILLKLLEKNKKIYNRFKKRYIQMSKIELNRIFSKIKFKAVLMYGKIDYKKLYQLSNLDAKKILYVDKKEDFDININKDIYCNLDYILTCNQETYNIIKEYCGQDKNIKLINKIKGLEDVFNSKIEVR